MPLSFGRRLIEKESRVAAMNDIKGFIETVVTKDGKISWKTHGRFDPEILKEADPEAKGAYDAKAKEAQEQEAVQDPSKLQPGEEALLVPVGDYFSELQEVVERVADGVVKYVMTDVMRDVIQDKDKKDSDGSGPADDINDMKKDFIGKLDEKNNDYKDALKALAVERRSKARGLRLFKKNNGLKEREAIYPESHTWHVALILAALFVEAMFNASFYAQASQMGLAGGLLTAALVSSANVAASFLIGILALRYIHHIQIFKKLLAWIGLVAGLMLVGFLHLTAAHYRELLLRDPESANQVVIPQTLADPFGITDIESFILVVLGWAISIWVIYKGYTFDDPYPGYGKVTRAWKRAEEAWSRADNELSKIIRSIVGEAERRRDQIASEIDKLGTELRTVSNDFSSYKDNVLTVVQAAIDDAVDAVIAYREGYNYVADRYVLPQDRDQLTEEVTKAFGVSNILRPLEEADKTISSCMARYKEWRKAIRASLDSGYEEIKEKAENLISEEEEKEARAVATTDAKEAARMTTVEEGVDED